MGSIRLELGTLAGPLLLVNVNVTRRLPKIESDQFESII